MLLYCCLLLWRGFWIYNCRIFWHFTWNMFSRVSFRCHCTVSSLLSIIYFTSCNSICSRGNKCRKLFSTHLFLACSLLSKRQELMVFSIHYLNLSTSIIRLNIACFFHLNSICRILRIFSIWVWVVLILWTCASFLLKLLYHHLLLEMEHFWKWRTITRWSLMFA